MRSLYDVNGSGFPEFSWNLWNRRKEEFEAPSVRFFETLLLAEESVRNNDFGFDSW